MGSPGMEIGDRRDPCDTLLVLRGGNSEVLKSPEVILMRNQKSNGIRLPLFVKKSNAESTEHYFIGDLTPVEASFSEERMPVGGGPDVSVVKMVFSLDKVVEDNLYKYLTGKG